MWMLQKQYSWISSPIYFADIFGLSYPHSVLPVCILGSIKVFVPTLYLLNRRHQILNGPHKIKLRICRCCLFGWATVYLPECAHFNLFLSLKSPKNLLVGSLVNFTYLWRRLFSSPYSQEKDPSMCVVYLLTKGQHAQSSILKISCVLHDSPPRWQKRITNLRKTS